MLTILGLIGLIYFIYMGFFFILRETVFISDKKQNVGCAKDSGITFINLQNLAVSRILQSVNNWDPRDQPLNMIPFEHFTQSLKKKKNIS